MSYSDITWLPLCAGLTILGLILTYFVARNRGRRAVMMGAAFSLLPVAAYLTGATEMLWKIGAAIGKFGTGFVFSPEKWAGIGVHAPAQAGLMPAGGRQRRKVAREQRRSARAEKEREQAEGSRTAPGIAAPDRTQELATRGSGRTPVPAERASQPAGKASRRQAQPVDEDMKDIEEILRKRGI